MSLAAVIVIGVLIGLIYRLVKDIKRNSEATSP